MFNVGIALCNINSLADQSGYGEQNKLIPNTSHIYLVQAKYFVKWVFLAFFTLKWDLHPLLKLYYFQNEKPKDN